MVRISKINKFRIILSLFFLTLISCNVFSPDYERFSGVSQPGDNSTIEGLMNNFVYSYAFKDSFLYSELLHDDFIFEYDNGGVIESWSKDEDIRITNRMFRNFNKIDVIFNTLFPQTISSSDTTVFTSFRIDFHTSSEIISLTGFSRFIFSKEIEQDSERYFIKFWSDLK